MNRTMMTFVVLAGIAAQTLQVQAANRFDEWDLRTTALDRARKADRADRTDRAESVIASSVPVSRPRNAVMLFAGPAIDDRLSKIAGLDFRPNFIAAGIVGRVASREVARFGSLSVEAEIGVGAQISTERRSAGSQFWLSAFLRYEAFPWNHVVRTTVAASTGLNNATQPARGEINGKEDRTFRLLHYLAPEISFAAPSRPERELVVRLHHRSGA